MISALILTHRIVGAAPVRAVRELAHVATIPNLALVAVSERYSCLSQVLPQNPLYCRRHGSILEALSRSSIWPKSVRCIVSSLLLGVQLTLVTEPIVNCRVSTPIYGLLLGV